MHRSIPAVAVAASLLATISCGGVSEGSESASTIANSVATTSTSIPDEQPTTSAPAADMATSTTTSPRPAQPSLAGFTVVIDPGHNGQNWNHPAEINAQVDIGTKTKECDTTGTQSYSGYSESDFTFDLSERLRALL
ncbi:MAG: N-acetylmuramoyl-L-alanine amidase, partial [Hyphomicrobiales bacterium]|nr:N-acetylmuramoyl-L-alanine amidase [Hyphomicrobiales bacterium]